MKIGEILASIRTERNLTMDAVANKCGLSKAYISRLEKAAKHNDAQQIRPSLETLRKIANGLDLDFNDLLFVLDDSQDETEGNFDIGVIDYDNVSPVEKKSIPLIGDIACGKPIYADAEQEVYVEAGTNIKADFCLRCKGDSMINARIYDGDIVFIRKQDMVNNGEIAAIIIGDEVTLKRVYYYRNDNIIRLIPENPKYEPLVYTNEDLEQIRIIGKAVAFQGNIE